jgi:hypothetical protein
MKYTFFEDIFILFCYNTLCSEHEAHLVLPGWAACKHRIPVLLLPLHALNEYAVPYVHFARSSFGISEPACDPLCWSYVVVNGIHVISRHDLVGC